MSNVRCGSDKFQDIVPVCAPESTDVLDPKVKLVPELVDADRVEPEHHRPAYPIPVRPRNSRSRSASQSPRVSRRHARVRTHRKRKERMYHPSSPTESVNSDLELLANKEKLKAVGDTKQTPLHRLAQDMDILPDRQHRAHRSRNKRELEEPQSGDSDSGHSESGYSDRSDEGYSDGEYDDDDELDEDFEDKPQHCQPGPAEPKFTYEQTIERRAAVIADLERRVMNGEKLDYHDNMTLDELLLLRAKSVHRGRSAQMLKLMRYGITMYVTLLEWVAKRVPALNLDLTDFGKEMFDKKSEYDDLLMEIYEMYGDSMKVNPVVMLLGTITLQAVMYSAARNFIKNAQFGLGIAPAAPAAVATNATAAAAAQPDIVDNGLQGPDGFDNSELLEICRREAEQKLKTKEDPVDMDAIQVDIPAPGVQIVRSGTSRKPRLNRTTKEKTMQPEQPKAPQPMQLSETIDI